MKRRISALAASVFLINLNVIGVDRACGPSHDVRQDAPSERAGHGEHHAPAPVQHDAPAKCCDALSSCGMTLSLGGDTVASPERAFAALDQRITFRSHDSAPRAPEPPPPKA